MADRNAKDGGPKASPAKARAGARQKPVKATRPKLSVKSETLKAAEPPKPIETVVEQALVAPVAAAKTVAQKALKKPAAPAPVPVQEAAELPAPVEIQAFAAGPWPTTPPLEDNLTTIHDNFKEGIDVMDAKINQTIDAGKDASKTAADQVQAVFGDINERAKGAMEKNAKIVQEVTELTKGNVEAIVTSSRVAAKGFENLSREAAEYGRKSFEDASGALKSFSEVRSPADLFRLQSDYARSYFDAMVSETSKMSEAVLKLAGEVAEPITSRYSVAAERVRTIAL